MLVISFDPGVETGIAFINLSKDNTHLIECCSESIIDADSWDSWFHLKLNTVTMRHFSVNGIVVAIETVKNVYPKVKTASGFKGIPARMATNLVETARIEERIAAAAKKNGFYVVTCAEREWRTGLFGRGASAAIVKQRLPFLCTGIPKQTNIHKRDAIATGLFCEKKYRLESLRAHPESNRNKTIM